jgi:hypothetical protein
MTLDQTDVIDFNMMHEPPTFATTVRTGTTNTLVVTDGGDFPGLLVQWPDALEEERASDFWALGLLHLTDVELVKLPPETRVEVMSKLAEVDQHDPRTLAPKVASIIREVTASHPGIAKTRFELTKNELETYRELLIIRATAPHVGPDDVTVVNIHGSMIAG